MTKEQILEKRRHLFGEEHMKLFSRIILEAMEEYAAMKAQPLVDTLETIKRKLDGLGDCITEDIYSIATNALASYAGSAEGERRVSIGEWIKYCNECGFPKDECNCPTIGKEPEKKDPWISVEDQPLVIDTKLGWECTEAGEGEFLAAIQVHDNSTNKDHWWIRHCVIEDMIGLCVVGDDENTPAGWDAKDVQYYCPLPEPPAATNQEGKSK